MQIFSKKGSLFNTQMIAYKMTTLLGQNNLLALVSRPCHSCSYTMLRLTKHMTQCNICFKLHSFTLFSHHCSHDPQQLRLNQVDYDVWTYCRGDHELFSDIEEHITPTFRDIKSPNTYGKLRSVTAKWRCWLQN